jgi:hypothetical protein
LLDTLQEQTLQFPFLQHRISGNETEHGSHVWIDHARAFGCTSDPDTLPSYRKFDRDLFVKSVTSHDGSGKCGSRLAIQAR